MLWRHLAWIALLAASASCSEKTERPSARSPSPTVVEVTAPAAKSPVDAGVMPGGDPRGLDGAPNGVAFFRDGSLAISTAKEIVTLDPSGALQRKPTGDRTPKLESNAMGFAPMVGEGVVLEGKDDLTLLETPSLRELYTGKGTPLSYPGAIATGGASPSVLVQVGGKLGRFAHAPGTSKSAENLTLTASAKLAIVTWISDNTNQYDATVFDVSTGRLIGRALAMPSFASEPLATLVGDLQYGIEKGSLVVIDLATAAVVRSAKIACPKGSFLGNPMTRPGGDLILVTCGSDGIALDARTLAPKRRYSKIMPGCDNGDFLPARFDPKVGSDLVIEGCGGEARLDLTTGKYRCSDEIGLVGAAYEPMMAPGPGGPGRRAPAGRENLPLCTKDGEPGVPMRLGSSGTYTLGYGANATEIVHANGKITLEEGATGLALSADETKLAYLLEDRVVVRSVPAGAVLQTIMKRP